MQDCSSNGYIPWRPYHVCWEISSRRYCVWNVSLQMSFHTRQHEGVDGKQLRINRLRRASMKMWNVETVEGKYRNTENGDVTEWRGKIKRGWNDYLNNWEKKKQWEQCYSCESSQKTWSCIKKLKWTDTGCTGVRSKRRAVIQSMKTALNEALKGGDGTYPDEKTKKSVLHIIQTSTISYGNSTVRFGPRKLEYRFSIESFSSSGL